MSSGSTDRVVAGADDGAGSLYGLLLAGWGGRGGGHGPSPGRGGAGGAGAGRGVLVDDARRWEPWRWKGAGCGPACKGGCEVNEGLGGLRKEGTQGLGVPGSSRGGPTTDPVLGLPGASYPPPTPPARGGRHRLLTGSCAIVF